VTVKLEQAEYDALQALAAEMAHITETADHHEPGSVDTGYEWTYAELLYWSEQEMVEARAEIARAFPSRRRS
jgi:hypothetical protein